MTPTLPSETVKATRNAKAIEATYQVSTLYWVCTDCGERHSNAYVAWYGAICYTDCNARLVPVAKPKPPR